MSILTYEPLDPTNAGRWRPLLCHEIFHLWNATAISSGEHQQYWFSEGATEYYAHLLPVRLGEVSGARFLETVSGKYAGYLEVAGAAGLLAAGDEKFLNHRLVYDGGALAALCLVRICAATSNRKSLDDVMKALYKKTSGRKGVDLTIELVAETVSRVAGRPMAEFFKRFIMGHEELPLAESLDLAGIELQVEVTQLPDTRAVLGQLLLLPSVARIPGGLHVLVSESELIRAGGLIVEVSGARIETFDDEEVTGCSTRNPNKLNSSSSSRRGAGIRSSWRSP